MLVNIIQYMLDLIQSLYQQNRWLLLFICKYIPLKQRTFDDSHSPKYQKFKTDILPRVIYQHQDWDWKDLIQYYTWKYGKPVTPVRRRSVCDIPENCSCPSCGAPQPYLYRNNGRAGQLMCKVCGKRFSPDENRFSRKLSFQCPYCGHALVHKKDRKHFIIHKCINPKCPYYLKNLAKVDKKHLNQPFGKNHYKLHYIYREFTVDFFKIDISGISKNISSLNFRKFNPHILGLCLTYHVNLGLSLRKTTQALADIHGIHISHQQVANYARAAALMIKPFTDTYDYKPSNQFAADETYIKVHGVKGFLWIIMDAVSRSILGYRVSQTRDVGPCIVTMRMAFRHFKEKLPKGFRFIADGYSAYPLAAQQIALALGKAFEFAVTRVIGLTNDDPVSTEFRPWKQKIERLNRTFKSSYRGTCGFDTFEGANYAVALWVTYYNFLRPHASNGRKVLNPLPALEECETMPAKWQILIQLGQETIRRADKSISA